MINACQEKHSDVGCEVKDPNGANLKAFRWRQSHDAQGAQVEKLPVGGRLSLDRLVVCIDHSPTARPMAQYTTGQREELDRAEQFCRPVGQCRNGELDSRQSRWQEEMR